MVAKGMQERGASVRQLARQLGVREGALRYRLKRAEGAARVDGRARQPTALDGLEEVVERIQEQLGDRRLSGEGRPCQVREIYEVLVREHGYRGSYQAVVRHLRRKHGAPKLRALRRVETPAGVQAQHDWYEVVTPIGSRRERLQVLTGTLSHSRARFNWVSRDQLGGEPARDPRLPGLVRGPTLQRTVRVGRSSGRGLGHARARGRQGRGRGGGAPRPRHKTAAAHRSGALRRSVDGARRTSDPRSFTELGFRWRACRATRRGPCCCRARSVFDDPSAGVGASGVLNISASRIWREYSGSVGLIRRPDTVVIGYCGEG